MELILNSCAKTWLLDCLPRLQAFGGQGRPTFFHPHLIRHQSGREKKSRQKILGKINAQLKAGSRTHLFCRAART